MPTIARRARLTTSILALAALGLTGCSYSRPDMTASLPKAEDVKPIEMPKEPVIGRDDGPGVTFRTLPADTFIPRMLNGSTKFPELKVGMVDFEDAPLWPSIQMIVDSLPEEGITLTREGKLDDRKVTVRNPGSTLRNVMPNVCRSAGVWCSWHDDGMGRRIAISERAVFSVPMPPEIPLNSNVQGGSGSNSCSSSGGSSSSNQSTLSQNNNPSSGTSSSSTGSNGGGHDDIVKAIERIAPDSKPVVDKASSMLTYSATIAEHDRINAYLRQAWENRAIITYDTYIWEVRLEDSNRSGIRWQDLRFNIGSAAFTGGGSTALNRTGDISNGVVFSNKDINIDLLFSFLKTQGSVRTVAQPKLSLLSGTEASFNDGDCFTYIRSIGDSTTDNLGRVTGGRVDPADLRTGLSLNIFGAYYNSTVTTKFALENSRLRSFDNYPTGNNGQLRLPQTAARNARQLVDVAPGDVLLLAGLTEDETSSTENGFPGNTVRTNQDARKVKRELVIVMIPKVTIYRRAE